jgi:TorA maturation chaperone TorD
VATSARAQPLAPSEDQALARAVVYTSLALALRPPDAEIRRKLEARPGEEALLKAAALLPVAGDAVRRLAEKARTVPLDEQRAVYTRLFGHTTRGCVSAYETEYGNDTPFQQPQQLSDIGGFLNAFGLKLDSTRHERIDHVSVECEFLAFLCAKESWAEEQRDPNMLEATRGAYRVFLRDHPGRFARALGRLLAVEDANGFYGAAGDALQSLISRECQRVGVPCGPEFLPLRTPDEDSTPMACSDAEPLLQIRSDGNPGAGCV